MVQIVVKITFHAQSHCDKRFFRPVADPIQRKTTINDRNWEILHLRDFVVVSPFLVGLCVVRGGFVGLGRGDDRAVVGRAVLPDGGGFLLVPLPVTACLVVGCAVLSTAGMNRSANTSIN